MCVSTNPGTDQPAFEIDFPLAGCDARGQCDDPAGGDADIDRRRCPGAISDHGVAQDEIHAGSRLAEIRAFERRVVRAAPMRGPRARSRPTPSRSRDRRPRAPAPPSDRPAGSSCPGRAIPRARGNSSPISAGASPSDGSSSSSTFGLAINPRAIASICCSPPDRSPARLCLRRSIDGKRSTIALTSASVAVAARVGAQAHVVEYRQLGKYLPPFGHEHEPRGGDLVRGERRDLGAREQQRSGDRPQQSRQRAHQRRLAGAVRAEDGHDLARAQAADPRSSAPIPRHSPR